MLLFDLEKMIPDPAKYPKDPIYLKDTHVKLMALAQDINQKLSDGENKESALKSLSMCLYYVRQGLQE